MRFTVASYNVLAQAYAHPKRYPGVPAASLERAARTASLLRRIEGLNADLLCLQEVEQECFDLLQDGLREAGYVGAWAQKRLGKPDGCATLWRSGRFVREGEHRVFFQDGLAGGPASGHVALAMILSDAGRRLGVVNTHLKWDDPKRPAEQRWCYRQAKELLAWTRDLRPAPEAWILCGDLNVAPGDDVLSLLRQGLLDAFEGQDGAHTCLASGHTAKIDHILHSAALRARPKPPPPLDGISALPSAEEPSDHVPLEAELAWADG